MSDRTVRAERVIGTVKRNARETVRISLRDKGGHTGLDLTVLKADAAGGHVPTGRGLRIPPEQIGALIAELREAERVARGLGLLPKPRLKPASGETEPVSAGCPTNMAIAPRRRAAGSRIVEADDLQNATFEVRTFRDSQKVISETVETDVAARTRFASAIDLCRTRDDAHQHRVELWQGDQLLDRWPTAARG